MRDYTEQERFHEFVSIIGKHHEKIKVIDFIVQTLILLLGFGLGLLVRF